MKALKICWVSDTHIGLRLDGADQTPDIIAIITRVVMKAKELKDQGYDVLLVFGGDIFNDNVPTESQIGAFLGVLALIDSLAIQTYVMVGNHEARANPERLSSLSFVQDAESVFTTIKLVEDITSMEYGTSVNGTVHLTFLPHISKALVEKKKLKASPQEYIETKVNKILAKIERKKCDHIIFSHLNVRGAHGGSEENLLKRSDVYLPNSVTDNCLSGIKPFIIQGHLHSHAVIDNIHIVGSPVFCSFNESGAKQFAVMTVGRELGDEWGIEYFPSLAPEFYECEINMIGKTEPFLKMTEVKDMLKQIPKDQKSVVKIDVTINPENNSYDWKKIHAKIQEHFPLSIVKTIVPRIVSKRLVRNDAQKIGLTPTDAVQAFIKSNWKSDKVKAKAIYKVAKQYL